MIKKIAFLSYLILLCACRLSADTSVSINYDSSSLQASYANKLLVQTLSQQGYSIQSGKSSYRIILNIDSLLGEEAFTILCEKKVITITGGDGRGVIYGAFSIAEDLRNGITLDQIQKKNESTQLHFRAIKYDLPWDTYRHSYSLTQHQETCSDLKYWEAFLDMMAENRFNALTLWNLHPYPFLIKPKNFPKASPWTDMEMETWQTLFSGIFHMAKERGIDTYIMPFNIFVSPEFSKAYSPIPMNLEHHHFVPADTTEIVKRYTRECVTQMLNEYPDLSGIGLTLGEGMAGMTPQERENWIRETIIEGMRLAGRKSKLIHRIPFSGNTGSLGATSVEMEQITRQGIEREAAMDCFEGPVWASLKFNWSHAHSTPKLIKVHGGKIYGTYWNPEPEGYKMVWTARNEDFFCLRWGVADFVREHIRTNTHGYLGGYFVGSETYIPAKDYFTKPGFDINWKYAFERQWLFYKLWGRLLYNPETPDTVFRNEFIRRYGKGMDVLFKASSLAGKTPLRLASSFDCTWDFTLYSEGFSALNPDIPREEFISVDRMINQKPLDTNYVSVEDYVKALTTEVLFEKERTTPPLLAQMLREDCLRALDLVKNIKTEGNDPLLFEIADIKAWAYLGLYFSEKLQGAIDFQTYRILGNEKKKAEAVRHLNIALEYWDQVITITRPLYRDMPLVHYSEQDGRTWQENDVLRFHWALLRPDVVKDIEIVQKSIYESPNF